jgi:hypothetical protein
LPAVNTGKIVQVDLLEESRSIFLYDATLGYLDALHVSIYVELGGSAQIFIDFRTCKI